MNRQEFKKEAQVNGTRFVEEITGRNTANIHLYRGGQHLGVYSFKGQHGEAPFAIKMEGRAEMTEWFENWHMKHIRGAFKEWRQTGRYNRFVIEVAGVKVRGTF